MIHAPELHRLVDELVGSLLHTEEGEPDGSTAQARERLIEFAGLHDLSVDSTAVLFRVASLEPVFSPVVVTIARNE